MNNSVSPIAPTTPTRRRPALLVGAVVLATLVLSGGAFLGARALTGDGGASEPAAGQVAQSAIPDHPDIQATYGVELLRVGLTGDDGLIDLRFRILDPGKASPVLGHHATVKTVIGDERSKKLFDTRAMTPGDSELVAGQGYYILFRNAQGQVRRGDWLDIFVGDLEIKHVRVV